MEKVDFIKVYALDEILKHLSEAGSDKRPRERKRVKIALRKINSWLREGAIAYEKERYKRAKVESKMQKV